MSDFLTYVPPPARKDTSKRVRYSTGLVLGEEEFQQDQAYFIERDRRHQRTLHGYGTVCGLALEPRDTGEGPEILVHPGLALNPAGETIVVPTAQCAALNAWIQRNRTAIDGFFGSPPGALTVDVQLCYRACDTDPTPVPGGPCRTQEELLQDSRTKDDFELRLELVDPTSPLASPPSSPVSGASGATLPEHQAVRALGDILASVVVGGGGPYVQPSDLAAWVHDIASGLGEPPVVLSPPAPPRPATIALDPTTAEEALRGALLTWVTQVRPRLASGCALAPPDAPCVSLGHLVLTLDAAGLLADASAVSVDEGTRPFLVSTQLLQEWSVASALAAALGGGAGPALPLVLAGDVVGPSGATSVQGLRGNAIAAAVSAGDTLVFDGATRTWVPQSPPFVGAAGGAYRVVAAGTFDARGTPGGAQYGRATVTPAGGPGLFDVTFPGYREPTPASRTMYVVRGTAFTGALPATVSLTRFDVRSLRIAVQDARGRAVSRGFQLEIMEYGP